MPFPNEEPSMKETKCNFMSGVGPFSTKFSGVCLSPLPLSPKSGHSANAHFYEYTP